VIFFSLVSFVPYFLFFHFLSETTYGIAYIKLSDLKPYILTEVKHFSSASSSSTSSKMKAVNDEMEDFYREYHDSLQSSSSSSSSGAAGMQPKRKSTANSLSGNRGLHGWFLTYSDLDVAKEARDKTVQCSSDPLHVLHSHHRHQQQLPTGNDIVVGKESTTEDHHNLSKKIMNPFFSEAPVLPSDQQSKNNNDLMIQIQLRIRVIEYIPTSITEHEGDSRFVGNVSNQK
jgi:hypothetical protein